MLAIHLPPGALTWQEVGTDSAWTTEAHLLAALIDATSWANWQRGGGKGEKPKPTPRPADLKEIQEKRERTLARAARFQARLNQ